MREDFRPGYVPNFDSSLNEVGLDGVDEPSVESGLSDLRNLWILDGGKLFALESENLDSS